MATNRAYDKYNEQAPWKNKERVVHRRTLIIILLLLVGMISSLFKVLLSDS